MKAKDWIKAGFFLYIGWEVSKIIDKTLGVYTMDWLRKCKPEYAAKLDATMEHIN